MIVIKENKIGINGTKNDIQWVMNELVKKYKGWKLIDAMEDIKKR